MTLRKIQNRKNNNSANKSGKKLLAVCLVSAMLAGLLGGCGGGQAQPEGASQENSSGGGVADSSNGNQTGEEENSAPTAMGRYMETKVDLPEYGYKSYGITVLTDGGLLIPDESAGQIVSGDGGETWEVKPIPGISSMSDFTKDKYIYCMAAAPDGTIAVLAVNRGEDDLSHPELHVAGADGTVCTMEELPVSTDDMYIYQIYYSPEGELFGTVVGSGEIYQIDVEQKTLTKYVSMEWRPDLIKFQGDYMLFLTSRDGVSIYDRKEKKWIEDGVLADFMKKNHLNEYYANDSYSVYVTPGEEDVIYIADKGGMYRHVIGGSAMEQIIDGTLTSFSNPSMSILGVAAFGENAFAVLFTGGKVALYHYDPDVPTVPENLVKVYSLEEQDTVWQAIAQFQTEHPDTFVKYEIGMNGTDGVSREDAVKKLNTELMAGSGPDVIILDGLPESSYAEKGILADLKPHIDSLTGDAVLLPNMVDAFTKDGKVYMMPVSFTLPMVVGRQADIEGIEDYASLADTVEKLRAEHPDAAISRFFSEEAMMRWFLPVTATAFVEESGRINEEVLSEFLELTNRIYQASQENLPAARREQYGWIKENYNANDWAYRNYNAVSQQTTDFFWEDMVLATGMLKSLYGYQEVLSIKYSDGFSDVGVKSFDGMSHGVFEPSVLVGLNASSTHQTEAEQFFDVIMGIQVQSLLYNGFMVNRTALERQLSPQWDIFGNGGMNVDYGEVSSSIGGSDGNGKEYHLDIYMPTKEEFQELYNLCCKLDTPYVADWVVEEAVIDIGAQYLSGYLTLDEAVRKIMAKVEIYAAE